MSQIALPADRRFHRAHVRPSRRRGRVRAALWPAVKYVLMLVFATGLAYRGALWLSETPALRIDRILVRGNSRMSAAQVQAVLGGLRGQNILFADLEEWRGRLMASAWVRDSTFKRTLPSTVEVAVTEREPLGIGRIKDRLFLVDERGHLIDEYGPQYQEFDLPIVDGLQPAEEWEEGQGRTSDADPRAALAARVILSLRAQPAIARRLSQVDVRDVHNVALIVDDDPAVIYVGEDRFLPKLESYLGLAPALRERVSEIDYVDLRFDNRVFVRPAKQQKKSAGERAAGRPAPADAAGTRR